MSNDLQEVFPSMKGFSKRNQELMRQWYSFWVRESSNAQQLVAQIPWGHNPTIGILICKAKNNTVVEYALKDIHKTMGVSEYTITRNLPEELKSSLPSIEEIEAELEGVDHGE